MNWTLAGYKSYIVGVLWVVLGVLSEWNTDMILQGLSVIALRAGISKNGTGK